MDLLKSAAQERDAAVLCSLHQIDLAREYADRIIGLNNGTIVFDGPPAALTSDAVQAIFEIDDTSPTLRREVAQIGDFALEAVGLRESSQIGRGMGSVTRDMFPIAISDRRPIDLMDGLDESRLPFLAHMETVEVQTTELDPDTLQMTTKVSERQFLVEPIGYLLFVLGKMVETIEIAIWASLIAILVSLPLAWLCASNYSPHPLIYGVARSLVSLLRSIPELISALFLVLAFGFGPIAGILALSFHSIGFLGKFYAEDIEAANKSPQQALKATGASDFAILRIAVLPQVLPSYTGLSLYILDRNIRMATVIGLVGAGASDRN
ncbi:phosphonate ABC transporter [Ostreococcus tauri]|uniref:Phosphonate ABC transporter n=1 Tax=Ostreococcus tauri TaxID=70448 RepID=A0A1Y5I5M8_OSTTA|nr:phosphonate ABC transporter [Ostreococcus tauri]